MAGDAANRKGKSKAHNARPRTLNELATVWQRELERASRPFVQLLRQSEEALRPYVEMQRQVQECLRPYAEMQRQVQERAREYAEWQRNVGLALRQWVEASQVTLGPWLRRLAEAAKQYQIVLDEVVPVLEKYKWFVTPSLPLPFVFYVVKEGRKRGRRDRDINRLFVDYFAAEDWRALRKMVDGWESNALFGKRLPILRDCVSVLRAAERGRFNAANVVLPTLLAQIDGLLSDYLDAKGVKRSAKYREKKSQFRKLKSESLPAGLEERACFVLLEILYQQALPGVKLKTRFNFNRHKIMHGEVVRYGRKDYVIPAFLVLDHLAHLRQPD